MSVIVEVGDSHHYAHVYRDGRVELLKGSFFSKADFYRTDPRRFLTILQGCHAPHTTNPCFSITWTSSRSVAEKAVLQVACSKAQSRAPSGNGRFPVERQRLCQCSWLLISIVLHSRIWPYSNLRRASAWKPRLPGLMAAIDRNVGHDLIGFQVHRHQG